MIAPLSLDIVDSQVTCVGDRQNCSLRPRSQKITTSKCPLLGNPKILYEPLTSNFSAHTDTPADEILCSQGDYVINQRNKIRLSLTEGVGGARMQIATKSYGAPVMLFIVC